MRSESGIVFSNFPSVLVQPLKRLIGRSRSDPYYFSASPFSDCGASDTLLATIMTTVTQHRLQLDDADANVLSPLLKVKPEEVDDVLSRHCSEHDIKLVVERIQKHLDATSSSDDAKHLGSYSQRDPQSRSQYIRTLVKLAGAFRILPEDIYVSGLECGHQIRPYARGAYWDLFVANLPASSNPQQLVAVRRPRLYVDCDEVDRNIRDTLTEAALWRQLHHKHILGFLGVERELFAPLNTLVLPWMENDHLTGYLRQQNLSASSINLLLLEVASGLQYLHSQSIIHGDLRAAHVLVTDERHACLGSFYTAAIAITPSGGADDDDISSSCVRWLAPELLESNCDALTEPSDIYSFGCVCLEAYTLKLPFWKIRKEYQVCSQRRDGLRICRPTPEECPGPVMSDSVWGMLEQCWDEHPSSRPTTSHVIEILGSLVVDVSGVQPTM